ncbi:MAG TPA: YhjD/YihY/BrkB family envelope integrity protein [Nocardioidaceae bacterium]|nr:YhjD/YihY/BrkB family envelope integrity protein [Nocardioidaceae bacterium]
MEDESRSRRAVAAARLAELRGRAEEMPAGSAAFAALKSEHDAGGGLIAGGVAFRFFLWLVPFGLIVASVGSLWSEYDETGLESAARDFGLGAAAADAASEGLQTGERNAVFLLVVGIVSLAWFTLGVLRASNIAYALAWRLEVPKIRRPLSAIAVPNGLLLLAFAVSAGTAWLREQIGTSALMGVFLGFATTTLIALYAMWLLPHRTSHPLELLPGAVMVGVGFQLMDVAVFFYFAPKLGESQETYGVFGAAATILVWLYVLCRTFTAAGFLNATLWERRHGAPGHSPPPGDTG